MDKKLREGQITFLQKIKPFLIRNHYIPSLPEGVEDVSTEVKASNEQVETLMKRIDKLERSLTSVGQMQEEGMRKSKMKDRILFLLNENKKLTANQLSELLGLSRTRCSEYFRELMIEGKVEGLIIDRQKYYKLLRM